MEKKSEVKTYVVYLHCDECGSEMKTVATDYSLLMLTNLSNTIEYIYRCPKCNCEVKSTELYPKIQYERASSDNIEDILP